MKSIFAILCLALVIAGSSAYPLEKLNQLCKRDKHRPEVTRVAEVKEIISMLKNGQGDCSGDVAAAITRLEPIVELTNVCSEEAADALVGFWRDHVRAKALSRRHLPKPLRKFFIAFGVQVSKLCKQTLMDKLREATWAKEIDSSTFFLVNEPATENIRKIFGEDLRIENLMALVQAEKRPVDEAKVGMYVAPEGVAKFMYVRSYCDEKFAPIYRNLIAPIVRLAIIGINYKGDTINEQMKLFQGDKLYKNWFAAVLVCESTSRFTPISNDNKEDDNKKVTFLNDDDMEELEKKGVAVNEGPKLVEPTNYKVDVVVVDQVLDRNDADLMQSVSNYKRILSDANKFRLRMLKKFPILMKNYVESKAIQWGLHPTRARDGKVSVTRHKIRNWIIFIASIVSIGSLVGTTIIAGMALFPLDGGLFYITLISVLAAGFSFMLVSIAGSAFNQIQHTRA